MLPVWTLFFSLHRYIWPALISHFDWQGSTGFGWGQIEINYLWQTILFIRLARNTAHISVFISSIKLMTGYGQIHIYSYLILVTAQLRKKSRFNWLISPFFSDTIILLPCSSKDSALPQWLLILFISDWTKKKKINPLDHSNLETGLNNLPWYSIHDYARA